MAATQTTSYGERIIECVLLYTLDEAMFPSPSPDPVSGSFTEQPRPPKALPTETCLFHGPAASGYQVMPLWRGEALRGKFKACFPAVDELKPQGMGTPFSDLQQLSIFAFPRGVELRALAPTGAGSSSGSGTGGSTGTAGAGGCLSKGLLGRSLPSRKTNLALHSTAWTNYWDEQGVGGDGDGSGAGGEEAARRSRAKAHAAADPQRLPSECAALSEAGVGVVGCPGEDRERQYFHCATVWRPVRPDILHSARLDLGASQVMRKNSTLNQNQTCPPNATPVESSSPSSSPSSASGGAGVGGGFGATGGAGSAPSVVDSFLPDDMFEPQVVVLVTKLPYHESFQSILRSFVQSNLSEAVKPDGPGFTKRHLQSLYEACCRPVRLELPSAWRRRTLELGPEQAAKVKQEAEAEAVAKSKQEEATASEATTGATATAPPPGTTQEKPQEGETGKQPGEQLGTRPVDSISGSKGGAEKEEAEEAAPSTPSPSQLSPRAPLYFFEEAEATSSPPPGDGSGEASGGGGGGDSIGGQQQPALQERKAASLRSSRLRVLQPPPGAMRVLRLPGKASGKEFFVPERPSAEWEDAFGARCVEVDLQPLLTRLQPSNVVRLFGALLLERSVLVLASDPSPLFDCLEALRTLLFPLTWYHIYLPALPDVPFMTGQLQAPVTYLAGAWKGSEGIMDNIKLENCVVADLDDDLVLDALDYLRHRHARNAAHARHQAELAAKTVAFSSSFAASRSLSMVAGNVSMVAGRIGGGLTTACAGGGSAGGGGSSASVTDGVVLGGRSSNGSCSGGGGNGGGGGGGGGGQGGEAWIEAVACDANFDFHEEVDWRLDQWGPFNEQNPRHTLAAPLPPRYALKLHREIRRYAPLYEHKRKHASGTGGGINGSGGGGSGANDHQFTFLPIELPVDASESLRLLVAREANGFENGVGVGVGVGGFLSASKSSSAAAPQSKADRAGIRSQSMSSGGGGSEGATATGATGGLGPAAAAAGGVSEKQATLSRGRTQSSNAAVSRSGSLGRRKSNMSHAVVTLNVLNVIEGSDSDQDDRDEREDDDEDDDEDEKTWTVVDGGGGGAEGAGGGGGGGSTTEGSSSVSAWKMTTDWQKTRFFSLRRAFFAVLTSLLKGYREHIRTAEHLRASSLSLKEETGAAAVVPAGGGGGAVVSDGGGGGGDAAGFGWAPLQMDEIFDLGGYVAMRERGQADENSSSLKAFLRIFMKLPVFENYMLGRASAKDMDALDRAIYESRSRRAFNASRSQVVKVQELGLAYKAKMGSHSNSLWGPNSWKRRAFELHHLGDNRVGPSASGGKEKSGVSGVSGGGGGGEEEAAAVEMLSLTYFQLDPALDKLKLQILELKEREKSSRDFADLRKQREVLEKDVEVRKKKAKKGEMILRKGQTSFQIPDSGKAGGGSSYAAASVSGEGTAAAVSVAAAGLGGGDDGSGGGGVDSSSAHGGSSSALSARGLTLNLNIAGKNCHRTAFAFEIHVQQGGSTPTQILTVCSDSHKERRQFIRTLQNALVTKAEVTRMRDQFLTPDAVREVHSRMGQRRRGDLTQRITDSFPAPFLSSSSSALPGSSDATTGPGHRGSFHFATVGAGGRASLSLMSPLSTSSSPLDPNGDADDGADGSVASSDYKGSGTVRFQVGEAEHRPPQHRPTVTWDDAPDVGGGVRGGAGEEAGGGRAGGNQCTVA